MLARPKTLGLVAAGIAAGIATMMIADQVTAQRFDNRSLRGTYFFNFVEVRDETPPGSPSQLLDHCDQWGELEFDGRGNASGTVTRRCSLSGSETSFGTAAYSVAPDGTFEIRADGELDGNHGQILLGGRLLLIDGTTRTRPDILVHHGVAARRGNGS